MSYKVIDDGIVRNFLRLFGHNEAHNEINRIDVDIRFRVIFYGFRVSFEVDAPEVSMVFGYMN